MNPLVRALGVAVGLQENSRFRILATWRQRCACFRHTCLPTDSAFSLQEHVATIFSLPPILLRYSWQVIVYICIWDVQHNDMIQEYTVQSSPLQVDLTSITSYSYNFFFFLQGELLRSPLRNSQIYNTCCSLSVLLYITSENLPCNWKSVVCIFDHPHFPLNTPVTGQPPICSLLLWGFLVFFFLVFCFSHISEITQKFIFLCLTFCT